MKTVPQELFNHNDPHRLFADRVFEIYRSLLPRKMRKVLRQTTFFLLGIGRQSVPQADPAAAKGVRDTVTDPISTRDDESVRIFLPAFFDRRGEKIIRGGAERYVMDLVELLRSIGYEPTLYQPGETHWRRYYKGLCINALEALDLSGFAELCSTKFGNCDLTIYLSPNVIPSRPHGNSLAISHGIYWDHESFQATPASVNFFSETILERFKRVDHVVSVDTNTINWVRARDQILANNFTYIPNYCFFDPAAATPSPAASRHADQEAALKILYPRTLYGPRGFWLLDEIAPDLLKKYPHVELMFVGHAFASEAAAVLSLQRAFPGRVSLTTCDHSEMAKVYESADITVIPTVNSEGTSFSCLEAQALGNAVIATNVGGLTDLVLNEFNGLLIPPTAEALRDAIEKLIGDAALRAELGKNAKAVAAKFPKSKWQAAWKTILKPYLREKTPAAFAPLRTVCFPATPGVNWNRMVQRPHRLAEMFAKSGYSVLWEDDTPVEDSGIPNVKVVPPGYSTRIARPIVVIYYPYNCGVVERYTDPFLIYDVLDSVEIHAASDRAFNVPAHKTAKSLHARLAQEADMVVTSSRLLLKELSAIRGDVVLVPNGVHTAPFKAKQPQLLDFRRGNRPVIGFHGMMGPWVDTVRLVRTALLRPDYDFVIAGPPCPDVVRAAIGAADNIRYIGEFSAQQIPQLVRSFDVGFVPFAEGRVSHAASPLKVFECLAAGRQVVATHLPEVSGLTGVFHVESKSTAMAEALDLALSTRGNLGDSPAWDDAVASFDWKSRMQPLLSALQMVETHA